MEKKDWKNIDFTEERFPVINCPTCNRGNLTVYNNTFKREESRDSKASANWGNNEYYNIDYRFSLLLICNNPKCKEIVSCLGKGFIEEVNEYNENTNEFDHSLVETYSPIFFYPSLNIIPISDDYPKQLIIELKNSFSHYFSDLPSCANKIRICIEILMNELKVKKQVQKVNKRRKLSLHERILEFEKTNPKIAENLLAIKWIGNSASHSMMDLTQDDVLDAYEIMEFSLNILFSKKERYIGKMTKEINKRRAPRSKTKKTQQNKI